MTDPDPDPVTRVAYATARMVKRFTSLRHHLPQERPGVDVTGFPILFALAHGPQRVSALADAVYSDVSTISRQVAALEKHRLLKRSPDPADGRASLVALTAEGSDLITTLVERRKTLFRAILADWSDRDVATLAALLDRLHADTDAHVDHLLRHTTSEGTP